MTEGKLNMKRVRNTLFWTAVMAGIFSLLWMAVNRKMNIGVKSLHVEIQSIGDDQRMISESEVIKQVEQFLGHKADSVKLKNIDVRALETFLNKDRRIEKADVYFNSNEELSVKIVQKKPVMRVIDKHNVSYYLDKEGSQIPAGINGAIRVQIVTGALGAYNPHFLEEKQSSKLKEVFEIVSFVQKDDFLNALIEQVHVEEGTGEIIMVPKIGRERLVFGDSERMEDKFDKLKIFYREGLPRLGWSKYKTLNLKYTDQIACTLR